MKKVKGLAALLGVALGCVSLTGCSIIKKGISTAEDFLSMKKGKSYRLEADIDLSGKTFAPLSVKNFDGAGHTIKNGKVRARFDKEKNQGGVFEYAENLNNVTFQSISCTFHGYPSNAAIGIAAGYVKKIENVDIIDCSIESSIVPNSNLSIGGAVGSAVSIKNCSIASTDIFWETEGKFSVNAGGFVGDMDGDINLCSVTVRSTNMEGKADNLGGCIGLCDADKGQIQDIKVDGLVAEGGGKNGGGVLGKENYYSNNSTSDLITISECSVVSSSIAGFELSGGITTSYPWKMENLLVQNCEISGGSSAGIVVSSQQGIRGCVGQKNSIYSTNDKGFAGGIMAKSATAVSCLSASNSVFGEQKDLFAPLAGTYRRCYLSENVSPNVNSLPVLSDEELEKTFQSSALIPRNGNAKKGVLTSNEKKRK